MKSKGMSSVVATIALILLSVAAVGFIAAFVVPFVKNQLNLGSECVSYRNYFTFTDEFEFNCYKRYGNDYLYAFSVKADSAGDNAEKNINGFELLVIKSGSSNKIGVFEGQNINRNANGIRMLNATKPIIEIPEAGGIKTYVYNSSTVKLSHVKIFPALKNGRTCDMTDSMNVEDEICMGDIS